MKGLTEKNWPLGYVRGEDRARDDVEIHYGVTEAFGQAQTEVGIWKNKYETGTSISVSFAGQAYYVCSLFVLWCSGDKWQLMERGEELAADTPDTWYHHYISFSLHLKLLMKAPNC